MTAEPLTRVFVYGTLMPGERNEHVAGRYGTPRAQPARLPGFRLLHLLPEAYPAVVPGASGEEVRGHVLTYAPEDWPRALPLLDELEGLHETPPLYTRERVTVALEDGRLQDAWVYVYANTARLARPGVHPLPNGEWREVPNRGRPGPQER